MSFEDFSGVFIFIFCFSGWLIFGLGISPLFCSIDKKTFKQYGMQISKPVLEICTKLKAIIGFKPVFSLLLLMSPSLLLAEEVVAKQKFDLTNHWTGYAALLLFFSAYLLAMVEEVTELRKSKPMVFAASLIWILIGVFYVQGGLSEEAGIAFRSSLEGYAELFLFIMVSMTYLNAMEDRGVFETLRVWLLSKSFTYRQLFWITGVQAFFISSVCNNLTTALLMGAVILAMGKNNRQFVTLACVNVVVAANAGGSFSPFGDITTLLVWQKGVVPFAHFFVLFIPAVVNFVLPAAIMHFFIPKEKPAALLEAQSLKRGGLVIIMLFLLTIVTATCFENFLNLPPAAGMMLGLTYLKFFSFYLQKTAHHSADPQHEKIALEALEALEKLEALELQGTEGNAPTGKRLGELLVSEQMITEYQLQQVLYIQDQHHKHGKVISQLAHDLPFDVFQKVSNLEWDTLLFFYGVMVAVGGLSFIGYLELTSHYLYGEIDPTVANILVGVASAFIDNGTIMLAVLTMAPHISEGQWLLVTLTAGVGGSLLAVGSAAGVGLMGQAKGIYTFTSHLKWTPVIAVGFAGSIAVHFLLNAHYF